MDTLGRLLRGFLVVACALFGLGAGLCSLGFLPSLLGSLFQGGGFDGGLAFLIINLLGFAIAGGCFYLIVKILKDRRQPNPIPRYTSDSPPRRDSDSPPPPG